jgi:dodecin
MSNTFKLVEIVGTSKNGLEKAIENAVAQAQSELGNLRWFQVTEIRGSLPDDNSIEYQVTVKFGSRAS